MEEFSTKDLHLAAYLKLKGAELLRLEKRQQAPGERVPVFFIFADKEKCQSLNKLFWDDGDFVNVKDYIAAVRDIRAQTVSLPNKDYKLFYK